MSEPLTAAVLLEAYLFGHLAACATGPAHMDKMLSSFRELIAGANAESAARAVDEALSVTDAPGEREFCCGEAQSYYERGWRERAAALVAHLRGPRPEGEG